MFCLLLAELLGHVCAHHSCGSVRISSVSRGRVSQWQNIFTHSGRLRWLLLKLDARAIRVQRCLNISNGSVVVQLLDSWTNTSSSIKLLMDVLRAGTCSASSQWSRWDGNYSFPVPVGGKVNKCLTLFWIFFNALQRFEELREFVICCGWQRPWKVDVWLWVQFKERKIRPGYI